MLPAAALALLAGLVIAGAWSATEAVDAAREVRRSSTDLANLSRLRLALMEARVQRPRMEDDSRPARTRSRGYLRRLAREEPAPDAPDSLLVLLRERGSASPDELPRIDRDLDRHVRLREETVSLRLEQATDRLQTRSLQTLFANLAVGLVALGAAAVALRPGTEERR